MDARAPVQLPCGVILLCPVRLLCSIGHASDNQTVSYRSYVYGFLHGYELDALEAKGLFNPHDPCEDRAAPGDHAKHFTSAIMRYGVSVKIRAL